jgi:hypothetical protein
VLVYWGANFLGTLSLLCLTFAENFFSRPTHDRGFGVFNLRRIFFRRVLIYWGVNFSGARSFLCLTFELMTMANGLNSLRCKLFGCPISSLSYFRWGKFFRVGPLTEAYGGVYFRNVIKMLNKTVTTSYGHTILKAPDPVRSPQLSNIWTSQYYGGGPHGNTGCCSFCYFCNF